MFYYLKRIKKYIHFKTKIVNMKKATKNTIKNKRLQLPADVSEIYNSSRYIQPYSLYFKLNNEIPNKYAFMNIDKGSLLEDIANEFGITINDSIMSQTYNFDKESYSLNSVMVPITKDVLLYLNPGVEDAPCVELLYTPGKSVDLVYKLEAMIKKCYTRTSNLGKIFLLQMQDYGGFDLVPFDIKNNEVDISKHYNDDFAEVNDVVIKRLNLENDKGLVLLHGKPGTGKTSYIRYLTSQVHKRMIFLSPELMHKISSPDFVGILSAYPNSIIIIEDAESIIEERKGGGGSAISNLLNLTDGLLADCLKIQLICSFNTDVSRIDKALLRKGRLIAQYDFKDLEQTKAQDLSNSLGFTAIINNALPLSDIFNQDEKIFTPEKDIKIGFNIKEKKVA